MITEDYVSFETAKLLKEKGFGGECMSMYVTPKPHAGMGNPNEAKIAPHGRDSHYYDGYLYQCEAPTLQMAMKWLRTNFNVNPVPYAMSLGWAFDIFDLSDRDITGSKKLFSMDFPKKSDCFSSYEEAAESAIRYYLEKREAVKKIRYELDAPLSHDINGRPIYFEDLKNSADNSAYPPSLEEAVKLYYNTYGNDRGGFDYMSLPKFQDIVETFVKDYGQKPAKWSEEDETCLEYALWCVMKTRHFVAKDACDLDACRSAERWLKFLPERFNLQPKQEWSEKDEEHINSIFNDFKQGVIPDKEDQEWLKNRLKSIRPQPHTVSIKKID